MKRVLCLWLPDWPIQRLRASRPELAGKIIVLHTHLAQRGLCVSTCCQGAGALGIAAGMTLSQAQSLLRRGARRSSSGPFRYSSPERAKGRPNGAPPLDWCIEPHDPSADLQALRELAWLCERFSPLVGLEEGKQPECLLLDATHLGPRRVPETLWLGELLGVFSQQGFSPRAGLADTVGLAWAIAHFSAPQESIPAIAPPGFSLEKLKDFPLAALRLEPVVLDLLSQLGVITIEHFLKLPRNGLATRFGPLTLRRIDQATGKEPEVFNAYRPTPPWREQRLLEHSTADREILEYALQQLLASLGKSLKAQDLGVMELACRLDGLTKPATALRIALFRPTADADHLFKLLHIQLENVAFPEPIESLSVEALRTARLEEHQGQFWRTQGALVNTPRLRGMIERMSSRLGPQRVLRARLRYDAQPEHAFVCEPLTNPSDPAPAAPARSQRRGASKRSAAGEAALLQESQHANAAWRILERPLLLLRPPREIEVTALAPEEPPSRIRWQGRWRCVAQHWGPERIDVGWHRGPSVRRDYYRIETEDGERVWLFQDRVRGGWKLHGFFS